MRPALLLCLLSTVPAVAEPAHWYGTLVQYEGEYLLIGDAGDYLPPVYRVDFPRRLGPQILEWYVGESVVIVGEQGPQSIRVTGIGYPEGEPFTGHVLRIGGSLLLVSDDLQEWAYLKFPTARAKRLALRTLPGERVDVFGMFVRRGAAIHAVNIRPAE